MDEAQSLLYVYGTAVDPGYARRQLPPVLEGAKSEVYILKYGRAALTVRSEYSAHILFFLREGLFKLFNGQREDALPVESVSSGLSRFDAGEAAPGILEGGRLFR